MRDSSTYCLLLWSRLLISTHADESRACWERSTGVNPKDLLWPTTDNHSCLILSVSRLAQVMLQSRVGDAWVGGLKLVRCLSHVQVTCFGKMHLLHVEVWLHLICVVVQVLLAATKLLLVESRVDPYLVAEDRFVFPMLNVHFLILVKSHLHRGLPHVLRIVV